MTSYLPYIINTSSLILGLYLFATSFKIYRPKHKTEEQSLKFENWLKKFGTMMKFISIVLILKGTWGLFNINPETYKTGSTKMKNGWNEGAREILISNCLRDAGPTAINYPKIGKEYCECSVDKLMYAFTQVEYEKSLKKPQAEQIVEQLPVFQSCVDELKRRIDSTDSVMEPIEKRKKGK